MPVYDRSYRRWDGELERRGLRFLPITTMGVRGAIGMKGGWFFTLLLRLFMLASLIPTLLLFFLNYVVAYRPSFLPAALVTFLEAWLPFRAVQYPLLTRLNVLFLMVYTVLFGSGLIAKDRASGALPLYLSRPLTLADYVLGKFGVIAWFVAAFTLVPNLALWLFGLLTDESPNAVRDAFALLPAIVAQNVVVVVTYGLTILAVSSLCRKAMYAALIWFTIVVLMPTFTAGFATHLGANWLAALSPNDAIYAVGYDLFDCRLLFDRALSTTGSFGPRHAIQALFGFMNVFRKTPVLPSWLSLAAWSGLSLTLLLARMRRQEVVGESGTR